MLREAHGYPGTGSDGFQEDVAEAGDDIVVPRDGTHGALTDAGFVVVAARKPE